MKEIDQYGLETHSLLSRFLTKNRLYKITLFALLLFAFLLRYKGIKFGFPIITHADEPTVVAAAMRILKQHSLNPHFFNYPSLFIYMQASLYAIVFALGKAGESIFGLAPNETITYYYWGRMLTIIMTLGSVYCTYKIGRVLFNKTAALMAVLFLCGCDLYVRYSYSITVDSPMSFWVMAALLSSALNYRYGPKMKYFVINGILVGLAIGTKYNAFLCAIPMIYVHLYHTSFSPAKFFNKGFLFGMILIPIVFFISTPFSVFDRDAFIKAILFEAKHYSRGHPGAESNSHSYAFYLKSLIDGYGPIFMSMSMIGFWALLKRHKHIAAMLICFPICYYLFIGRFVVRFHRNALALVPFFALFGGYGFYFIADYCKKSFNSTTALRFVVGLMTIIIAIGLSDQLQKICYNLQYRTLPNTRWISMVWVQENLPAGISIGREHYTPPLKSGKFKVARLGFSGLIKKDISEFDYIIASSGNYERFFKKKDKYSEEIAKYNKIFSEYILVKQFIPDGKISGGLTILIYKAP
jgi:4-amino-4-deoxy-L-arabinose transferase-like glycosyltransferase